MSQQNPNENRTGQEGAPVSHPQTGAGHDEQGRTGVAGGADGDVHKNDESSDEPEREESGQTPGLYPHRGRKVPGHGQSSDVHHGPDRQND